jgi:hypothetical protein
VSLSYALVFAAEAGLFVVAACMALWIGKPVAFNQAVEEAPWVAKQEA